VLTFLHWRFPPEAVQRLLPPGLEVETRDGSAWVGLIPFLMAVGLPHVEPLPWASRFCETNVRTYVRDEAGRSGIWFFSLDAARLGAVVVARSAYRLPYFWAAMSVQHPGPAGPGGHKQSPAGPGGHKQGPAGPGGHQQGPAGPGGHKQSPAGPGGHQQSPAGPGGHWDGTTIRYRCRRRAPGPIGTRSHASIEIAAPYLPSELSPLEHFLTARWVLFSVAGDRRRYALAEHPPWPLHRARVLDLHDELLGAAGLPPSVGAPLVHFSPGVRVKIGHPRK